MNTVALGLSLARACSSLRIGCSITMSDFVRFVRSDRNVLSTVNVPEQFKTTAMWGIASGQLYWRDTKDDYWYARGYLSVDHAERICFLLNLGENISDLKVDYEGKRD
jgi:uncharacterized protein (DUF2237 family)